MTHSELQRIKLACTFKSYLNGHSANYVGCLSLYEGVVMEDLISAALEAISDIRYVTVVSLPLLDIYY